MFVLIPQKDIFQDVGVDRTKLRGVCFYEGILLGSSKKNLNSYTNINNLVVTAPRKHKIWYAKRYLRYFYVSDLDSLLNGEIKSDDVCGKTTSVSLSLIK